MHLLLADIGILLELVELLLLLGTLNGFVLHEALLALIALLQLHAENGVTVHVTLALRSLFNGEDLGHYFVVRRGVLEQHLVHLTLELAAVHHFENKALQMTEAVDEVSLLVDLFNEFQETPEALLLALPGEHSFWPDGSEVLQQKLDFLAGFSFFEDEVVHDDQLGSEHHLILLQSDD